MRFYQLVLLMDAVLSTVLRADPDSAFKDSKLDTHGARSLALENNSTTKLLIADAGDDEDRGLPYIPVVDTLAESFTLTGKSHTEAFKKLQLGKVLTSENIGDAKTAERFFTSSTFKDWSEHSSKLFKEPDIATYTQLTELFGEKQVAYFLVSASSWKAHDAAKKLRKVQHAEWLRLEISPDQLLKRFGVTDNPSAKDKKVKNMYSVFYNTELGYARQAVSLYTSLKGMIP